MADRHVIISDTHLSSPSVDSKSLFPGWIEEIGEDKGKDLYKKIADQCRIAYQSCVADIRKSKPDAIIHLGDITGGWQEKGIIEPSIQHIAQQTREELQLIAPSFFVMGNHDTGYVGSLLESGINEDSISACQETFGDLYWSLDQSGVHMVGICTPLLDKELPENLQSLRNDQIEFVGDTLQTYRGEPWVLYAHDPFSPARLHKQIAPHMTEMQRFVFGDLHDPLKGRALKNLGKLPVWQLLPSKEKRLLAKMIQRGVLCPSTAPLWWQGYSYLEAEEKNGFYETEQKKVASAPDTRRVPTDSMIKCALGMLRGKI